MSNKLRYLIAFAVLVIAFLPMADTAFCTSEYIPLVDYIVAVAGFMLACYITETRPYRSYQDDNDRR